MLTRLEVNGFKNLVDFALDFGPYTCIAGANGVGKSNIFDAIRFLSLLTENTINQAALQIRNAGEETGDIADLLFYGGGERSDRMEFAAEMIVDRKVADDFGRQAEPSSSFLRYEVAFRYEPPAASLGQLGGLALEREELRAINVRQAANHLRFPHSKSKFRDRVVYNRRHSRSGYISTEVEPDTGQASIVVHQDGGSQGRGRPAPPAPAADTTRTIIGTENTAATPTILAARREMQSWRILALEPAAMRRPDRYTQPPGIASNGAHIPATLQHLANTAHKYDDTPEALFGFVSRMLAGLGTAGTVRVTQDDAQQLLSLEVKQRSGLILRGNAIADSTLRFLALITLSEIPEQTAVYCIEEPENGIHPGSLASLNHRLHDIAIDVDYPLDFDNPLRQVIAVTHSPHFVQLQNEDELVLASEHIKRSDCGKRIRNLLKCQGYKGTWRSAGDERAGFYSGHLHPYILPPEEAQFTYPKEIWESL